jgi:hypothetical protein
MIARQFTALVQRRKPARGSLPQRPYARIDHQLGLPTPRWVLERMYSITKKRALTSKREMLLTFPREFSGSRGAALR